MKYLLDSEEYEALVKLKKTKVPVSKAEMIARFKRAPGLGPVTIQAVFDCLEYEKWTIYNEDEPTRDRATND